MIAGKHCILVVDDETTLLKLMAAYSRRLGFDVLTAPDGEEALTTYIANQGSIDLLVTDISMPGMSGVDLVEEVVAIRPDLPVMFCSGYPFDPVASSAQTKLML